MFSMILVAVALVSAFTGSQADSAPAANDVSFLQHALEVKSQADGEIKCGTEVCDCDGDCTMWNAAGINHMCPKECSVWKTGGCCMNKWKSIAAAQAKAAEDRAKWGEEPEEQPLKSCTAHDKCGKGEYCSDHGCMKCEECECDFAGTGGTCGTCPQGIKCKSLVECTGDTCAKHVCSSLVPTFEPSGVDDLDKCKEQCKQAKYRGEQGVWKKGVWKHLMEGETDPKEEWKPEPPCYGITFEEKTKICKLYSAACSSDSAGIKSLYKPGAPKVTPCTDCNCLEWDGASNTYKTCRVEKCTRFCAKCETGQKDGVTFVKPKAGSFTTHKYQCLP